MIVNEARVETFERIFETKPEHVDGAKVRCWYCGTEITYRTAAIEGGRRDSYKRETQYILWAPFPRSGCPGQNTH